MNTISINLISNFVHPKGSQVVISQLSRSSTADIGSYLLSSILDPTQQIILLMDPLSSLYFSSEEDLFLMIGGDEVVKVLQVRQDGSLNVSRAVAGTARPYPAMTAVQRVVEISSGPADSPISRFAGWNRTLGELTVNISSDLSSDQYHAFIFHLRNPSLAFQSPQISISSFFNGQMIAYPVAMPSNTNCTRPIFVQTPQFLVREVHSNTNFPGVKNVISVTFQTNTALRESSQLVIYGLPSDLLSTSVVSLNAESGNFASTFNPTASWTSGNMTISVRSSAVSQAYSSYSFNFSVTNSPMQRSSPKVYILASGLVNIQGSLVVSGTGRDLSISLPYAYMEQSSYFPGQKNNILVNLRLGVDLRTGDVLTISGLSGMTALDNPPTSLSFDASKLMLKYTSGAAVSAGNVITFTFTVVNPFKANSIAPPHIYGNRSGVILVPDLTFILPSDVYKTPLYVQVPSFTSVRFFQV